ncbi:SpoIID/LytB domain [Thermosinus carboxydivorans Nor1]|uniref:SpoIID/LytB domain n=1 Tax=Thermosinus carboxydivorans Nor1 TaxID=401526 RepID=A1HRD8_9FIRM|nr:stage II sporulation protein D [Thermosinus carboxydivorans]EAX47453.1 SpoIID/LytB domain [Thermosinus carboxydivorans Nor1]
MRQVAVLTAIIVILIVIVLPAIIVRGIPAATTIQPRANVHKGEDIPIKVYLHEADKIVEMNLEDYIKGVVAAEMPAEFELEALKAQAVAARTYAVKQMVLFGGSGLPDRPGADVSTDHRQGQAWLSEAQLRQRWGPFKSDVYWQKISQAVDETRGLILTYSGEPIHAVFHSTSGERTASAQEVWGFDYPYLKSVACKWDQKSPRYTDAKEITLTELEQRLGADVGALAAAKTGETAIAQVLDRTESGRVDKVRIGAKTFSGVAIREKLDLRSANFTVETKEDRLVFKTIGYGHGVGLCQYGANGMAKEGRTFREILTYYYTGVAIRDIHGS